MKRVKRRRERNEKKRIRMRKERWKFEQFCFSGRNIEDEGRIRIRRKMHLRK